MDKTLPNQAHFARLVRSALARLYDPVSLNAHPLAPLLVGDDLLGAGNSPIGLALRKRLLDAIELLKPDPQVDQNSKTWRSYRLLLLRYAQAREPTEVQQQLASSKSQYYRDHEQALEQLAEVLWQQSRKTAPQRASAPQPRKPGLAGHNLPLQITSFVGREPELTQVEALMETRRLLTLSGAGGSGKTRLALEAAAALLDRFEDGVWVVDLAALGEPDLVPHTVAATLGVREEVGDLPEATLVRTLAGQQRLVVFDNCEHLIEACARLVDLLLRACPRLTILCTSREPLHISGEMIFQVPTLSTADTGHLPSLDRLETVEAIQLFIERAKAVHRSFVLTAANASAVAAICARLDGIPLAIELAAARMQALSVQQINDRLDDRFALLTRGSRTALPRHQTLRAMVDWSVGLLSDAERTLFSRLSIFAGGWTLEEAEAVCSGEPVASEAVLELLDQLVTKSLVLAEEWGSAVRYRMLETLRQYAFDLLLANGGAYDVQCQHGQFFLALAEQSEVVLSGPDQRKWLLRFEREQDNFRAALRWAIDNEGPTGETALRIATALTRVFWQIHGQYRREGLGWLSAAVSRSTDASPTVRAAALQMAGHQAFKLCELDRASAYLEEAARLYRAMASATVPPEVLSTMGRLAGLRGSYEEGSALLREAMTRARELGDNRTVQLGYWYLGEIQVQQGAWEEASATLEQGIAVSRQLGDEHYAAHCANELGAVVRRQGDAERARRLHDTSLAVFESLSDTEGIASVFYYLGVLALEQGDVAAAAAQLQRSLALNAEIGYSQEVAPCLEGLAAIAAAGKDWQGAARLLGAAEAVREGIGVPLPSAERITHERLRAELRNGLGALELAEAINIGRHTKLDVWTHGGGDAPE